MWVRTHVGGLDVCMMMRITELKLLDGIAIRAWPANFSQGDVLRCDIYPEQDCARVG